MACHELVRLQAMGMPWLRISVNVSQLQFRHPDFVEKLMRAIADTGVDAANLELEITESVAMEDPDFMLERFAVIKAIGVTIAIDDFGTGYSSLSHLRQLPIDRLKIDRAFVNELSSDILGGPIAAMVIELGRNLNMTVIAEGIETENQANILRKMGCHEGQGYFYAKPLAPPELREWLLAHQAKS
jgi:EAL domain-containing protein (putative c-di-GMP-specific phosphodiesterase class I)